MKGILIAVLMLILGNNSYAEEQSVWSWLFALQRQNEVAAFNDAQYLEECGSCHFAYPAGLLPARSWQKLMAAKSLEDHFGDNAELDEGLRQKLEALLVDSAADKSYYKRSRKIMVSLREDETPSRITEVRFFKRKHHDLEDRHVKDNEKVKSFSYCNKCHRLAKEGIFDDDTVDIPQFGRWTW